MDESHASPSTPDPGDSQRGAAPRRAAGEGAADPIDQLDLLLGHSGWMQGLAQRLLAGDVHLAADTTQEAWLAYLQAAPQEERPVEPWLSRVVRYLSHKERRSSQRRRRREQHVARRDQAPATVDVVARAESQQWLVSHVMNLHEPYRSTVLHRYFDGLSTVEIAARDGVTDAAVRMRLKRAHELLRQRVDEEPRDDTNRALAILALGPAATALPIAAESAAGASSSTTPMTPTTTISTTTTIGVLVSAKKIVATLAVLVLIGGAWWVASGPWDDGGNERAKRVESSDSSGANAADSADGSDEDAESQRGGGGPDGAGADSESGEKSGAEENTAESAGEGAAPTGNGRLLVHVIGPDDEPLDARVEVTRATIPITELGVKPTDADGVATFSSVPEGRYVVEAFLGETWMQGEVAFSAEVAEKEITLRFPGTLTVSGRVYGRGGRMEIDVRGERFVLGEEEVAVDLLPYEAGDATESEATESSADAKKPTLSVIVQGDGTYRLEGVAPGTYLLRIKSKFHVEKLSVTEDVVHDVELSDGEVSGHVLDATSGKPAEYVQVIIGLKSSHIDKDLLRASGLEVVSDRLSPDEAGFYRFSHLPPGDYSILCNGSNHSPKRQSCTIPTADGRVTLDFELTRGTYIELAIQDKAGNDLEHPKCWLGGISWGFTGRVGGLPPGEHDVFGYAPGHELQLRKKVEFKPGEGTPVKFQLPRAADTRVHFVDDLGKPIPGVRVQVPFGDYDVLKMCRTLMRDPQTPSSRTRDEGYVLLRGCVAGPRRVIAKKSGYALFDEELTLDGEVPEQRITLERADTKFEWRLRVTSVGEGSESAAIGIAVGDVLRSYAGQTISSLEELQEAIRKAAAVPEKEHVEVIIENDAGTRTLQARTGTLGIRTEEFELE